jgi:hypothetical protein
VKKYNFTTTPSAKCKTAALIEMANHLLLAVFICVQRLRIKNMAEVTLVIPTTVHLIISHGAMDKSYNHIHTKVTSHHPR